MANGPFLNKTGLINLQSKINSIYTRKDSISNKGATLSNGNYVTIASIGGKNITAALPRQPLYLCNVNNGNQNNYKYHRFARVGSKASPISSSYIDYDMILSIRQRYNNGGYGILKLSVRKNDTSTVSNCSAQWLVRNRFKEDAVKMGIVDSPTGTFVDVFFEAPHTYIRVEIAAIQVITSFDLISTFECDNTTTSSKLTSYEVYSSIESACTEIHGAGSTYTHIVSSTHMGVNFGDTWVNTLTSANGVYGSCLVAQGSPTYVELPNSADIDGNNQYNPRMMSYSHSNSNDGALIDIGLYRNGYDYRTLRIKSLDSDVSRISLCEMRGGSADNHTFESFELWGRHNTVPIANGGTGQKSRVDAMNALFSLGGNVISSTTNDTTAKWGALGPGYSFYSTAGQLNDQPQQYGFVLNIPNVKSAEVFQIWHNQPSGNMYHRGGNNSNWSGTWRCLLDSSNYTTYVVPKTGGTFTGAITAPSFTATSDERLKTNIKDYIPIANILDLPVKEFDYIETGKHSIGCIAQDLQKMFPELVHECENGYLSVNEGKLVYLLLLKVKELESLINNLRKS